MTRAWVSGWCLLVAFGCGARTELLVDAETNPENAAGAPLTMHCDLTGNDARVAGIKPEQLASLDGADFVVGDVKAYHWTVQKEDCDAVVANAEFKLEGADTRFLTFQPSRPAFYHLTLEATDSAGRKASCKLEVPVEGTGMRVELCWDTSTSTDLDLYVHNPFDREPWLNRGATDVESGLNNTTCNTSNAVAELRGQPRVSWGYADSTLQACNTPSFKGFLDTGRCPNPRAANDNNQMIANGTTERVQLDNPLAGQTFRVMVHNFNDRPAHPHVFVYCGGQKAAAFDAPSAPPNFVTSNSKPFGLMWRAADITTNIDPGGNVSCGAVPVTTNAVTVNDTSF